MRDRYNLSYTYIKEPFEFDSNFLVQLGRIHCKPLANIRKHAHIFWYELTIITDGEGEILTNDYSSHVSPGDIYLSCPGDFHEINSSKDRPLKFDLLAFYTDNPDLKKELKRITNNIYNYNNRIFRDEKIGNAVCDVILEFGLKEKYKKEIISSLVNQILFLTARNFDSMSFKKVKTTNSLDELCFQIMYYIDTHIYSIKSLSELSEEFSYNYSYLSNLFKKHTGITLLEYYKNRRLDAARLLLMEGEFKINYIAQKLNYSSLYSFSKAFKNKYGVSPKVYKEKPL